MAPPGGSRPLSPKMADKEFIRYLQAQVEMLKRKLKKEEERNEKQHNEQH